MAVPSKIVGGSRKWHVFYGIKKYVWEPKIAWGKSTIKKTYGGINAIKKPNKNAWGIPIFILRKMFPTPHIFLRNNCYGANLICINVCQIIVKNVSSEMNVLSILHPLFKVFTTLRMQDLF